MGDRMDLYSETLNVFNFSLQIFGYELESEEIIEYSDEKSYIF